MRIAAPRTIWMCAAATACGAPTDSLLWRETWEAFAILPQGVVEVCAETGNQGLRRGLGKVQARQVSAEGEALLLMESPITSTITIGADHENIQVGSAHVGKSALGDHWQILQPDDPPLGLSISDAPGLGTPQASFVDRFGAFRVEVPIVAGRAVGTLWTEDGIVSGPAIAIHRGGDAVPHGPRRLLLAMGPNRVVGFESQGEGELAWVLGDGVLSTPDDGRITEWSEDGARLEIPSMGLVATFHPMGDPGSEPIDRTWLTPERVALDLVGIPTERDVHLAEVTIDQGGVSHHVRGVVLEER